MITAGAILDQQTGGQVTHTPGVPGGLPGDIVGHEAGVHVEEQKTQSTPTTIRLKVRIHFICLQQ